MPTIFTTTSLEGQGFINGGTFGFEGGIVASVVFAVAPADLQTKPTGAGGAGVVA